MTNSTASEQDQIRSLVQSVLRAVSAKNPEEVAACYTPDCVQYGLAPPLRESGTDKHALAAWFATWRGPIGLESRDLSVTAGQDVAFCTSLNRMTGTKIDGEEPDLWYRATLGLRRVDGRWRIAHEHWSVPFYMDGSYKAAVDLQP